MCGSGSLAKPRLKGNNAQRRIGVLLSGGLDSAALVAFYLEKGMEVWPIYVKSALPWEQAEIAGTRRFLTRIRSSLLKPTLFAELRLEMAYDGNWSKLGRIPEAGTDDRAVFLPARNLLLITK